MSAPIERWTLRFCGPPMLIATFELVPLAQSPAPVGSVEPSMVTLTDPTVEFGHFGPGPQAAAIKQRVGRTRRRISGKSKSGLKRRRVLPAEGSAIAQSFRE